MNWMWGILIGLVIGGIIGAAVLFKVVAGITPWGPR